jgi:hypothetical protein
MQEKVSFMFFSVRMGMSAPQDNCFGGNSAEPCHTPNTVIPRDGNFDSHLKPMKDTYNLVYFLFHVLVSSKCVKRVR